ncbi:MAG: ABC transporter permease subunit [Thermomicrobiales bacterium]
MNVAPQLAPPASVLPAGRSERIRTHSTHTLPIYTEHLLRGGVRSAAIWTAAVSAYLVALTLSFRQISPAVSTTQYPEGLARAFNISDMHSITGFLSTEVFSFIPIIMAIYPILLAANAIAGAEERGQLDLPLGTPLSRKDLVLARAISAAILILGMLATTAALGWLAGVVSGEDLPASTIFGASLALWPFMLFFGAVGLVASALTHRFATAMGATVGVLVVMYALDLIARLAQKDAFGWFSAFHYYGTPMLDGVNWAGAVGMTLCAILLCGAAIVAFTRRDIYS